MAYIPTEWETGDVITAAKLNNIEDGIVNDDSRIDAIMPYVVEANVEINPQNFTIVDNTFEVIDGTFVEATSAFAKSLLVVHLIITGTSVIYCDIFLKPSTHRLKIQGVSDSEEFGWTTSFALPVAGSMVAFSQVTYNADSQDAVPAMVAFAPA